jgi:hypothetical protein
MGEKAEIWKAEIGIKSFKRVFRKFLQVFPLTVATPIQVGCFA